MTGFGRGGRAVWLFDAHSPALKAAVAWGGNVAGATTPTQPKTALEVAADIRAPLLGLYGKDDRSAPRSLLLQAESKAKAAGKTAETIAHVGAGAAFATDDRSMASKAAALDGWQRMLAWFKRYGSM